MRGKDTQIAIRISEDLKRQLKRYAEEDERSLSAFIRKILSDTCHKYEQKLSPGSIKPGDNPGDSTSNPHLN